MSWMNSRLKVSRHRSSNGSKVLQLDLVHDLPYLDVMYNERKTV